MDKFWVWVVAQELLKPICIDWGNDGEEMRKGFDGTCDVSISIVRGGHTRDCGSTLSVHCQRCAIEITLSKDELHILGPLSLEFEIICEPPPSLYKHSGIQSDCLMNTSSICG